MAHVSNTRNSVLIPNNSGNVSVASGQYKARTVFDAEEESKNDGYKGSGNGSSNGGDRKYVAHIKERRLYFHSSSFLLPPLSLCIYPINSQIKQSLNEV